MVGAVVDGRDSVFLSRFSPGVFLEAVDRHRPTTVGLVPTMLQMLISHEDKTSYDLTSVRVLRYGASPISPTLLGQVMHMFPNSASRRATG